MAHRNAHARRGSRSDPKSNEALVQIKAAGVNFIDVYFREGRYPAPLPFINGRESAGIVVAVGPDVTTLRLGDRVAYTGLLGSYAEYAAVPADRLVKIPAELDFEQAAAAMLQGMTAHYLSHSTYPIKNGETALIHAAAGGVGLLLVQMAKRLGARVIATAGSEEKAQLARDAGADEVIIYTEQDFQTETKRLTASGRARCLRRRGQRHFRARPECFASARVLASSAVRVEQCRLSIFLS